MIIGQLHGFDNRANNVQDIHTVSTKELCHQEHNKDYVAIKSFLFRALCNIVDRFSVDSGV